MMIIALGSNLGDRKQFLTQALTGISQSFDIVCFSRIYLSTPVDYLNQPDFYNMVIICETPHFSPIETLTILKSLENKIGSPKLVAKGPRIIDIDILFFDFETVDTPDLIVPHPAFMKRSFTVYPLLEILPYNQFLFILESLKIRNELPRYSKLRPIGHI